LAAWRMASLRGVNSFSTSVSPFIDVLITVVVA
jgi:hypothetical protein